MMTKLAQLRFICQDLQGRTVKMIFKGAMKTQYNIGYHSILNKPR